MQIIVDVDDTVADLVSEWLKRYNFDYGETLKKSNITQWDISLFLKKPENKEFLYQYIEDPSIYDNIKPIKDALWGINKLKSMGNRVVFVTAATSGHGQRKYKWLKDNKFIESKNDYVECFDKRLIRGHYIIDDRPLNVKSFQGRGILFNAPWNKDEHWNLKADSWKHVVKIISSIGEFGYL